MKKVPRSLKFAIIVLTVTYVIGIATMAYLDFFGMKELIPLACDITLVAMFAGLLAFTALAYRLKLSMVVCRQAPSIWRHFWYLPHRHH